MLFDVDAISTEQCGTTIKNAILARDPTATVVVSTDDKRVRVEGLLTEQQAIDALSAAGYPASEAAPHSGEGSQCCGGCS